MSAKQFVGSAPYSSPSCRMIDIHLDQNFLASSDFSGDGYPGSDLEPGDEFDF